MKKFSVIIPVYNTQEYLRKCLDSIVNQTIPREEMEIIVVNDGSPDNSESIIKEYERKFPNLINYIKKENGGPGTARNIGIDNAIGEYLVLVDSDDYLDINLFEKLEEHIKKNNYPDVIKINSRDVKTDGSIIQEIEIKLGNNDVELLKDIVAKGALEVPWGYVYNTKFFKENKFKYEPKIHEDYGLTPIILYKAKTISLLPYIGYNYVEREGSIIAETNYEKIKARVDDMYYLYRIHLKEIHKDNEKGKLLRGYSLEALLSKLTFLNKKDRKLKVKEIRNNLNPKDIYCYNSKKVIKKVILSININLYLNLYAKYKF